MPGPVALLWEMEASASPCVGKPGLGPRLPTTLPDPLLCGLNFLFPSKAAPAPERVAVMGCGREGLLSKKGCFAPEVALHFLSQLKTTTTAVVSKDFTEDRIWLNGREEDIGQPRIQACLRESEWGSRMGHWGPSQPVPSPPSLPYLGRSQSTAGAAPSPPGSESPWGLGAPVSTARFGSGSGAFLNKEVCRNLRQRPGISCISDPWQARCQEQVRAALPSGYLPLPTVRRLARKRRSGDEEDLLPLSLNYKVHIASVNNFPTAAGLASSASGYACLGGCPQGHACSCSFRGALVPRGGGLGCSHI